MVSVESEKEEKLLLANWAHTKQALASTLRAEVQSSAEVRVQGQHRRLCGGRSKMMPNGKSLRSLCKKMKRSRKSKELSIVC